MTVVGNFHPASRVLSNLVFAEYPLRDSMDLVELRLDSCFFGSGVFGVRSVWLEKTGVELFFLDLELFGALPNTPIHNLFKLNYILSSSGIMYNDFSPHLYMHREITIES
jgi:hypothetical protein